MNSEQVDVDEPNPVDDQWDDVNLNLSEELQEIYNTIVKQVVNEACAPEPEGGEVTMVVAKGVVEEPVGHIRELSTDDIVSPYCQTCERYSPEFFKRTIQHLQRLYEQQWSCQWSLKETLHPL